MKPAYEMSPEEYADKRAQLRGAYAQALLHGTTDEHCFRLAISRLDYEWSQRKEKA